MKKVLFTVMFLVFVSVSVAAFAVESVEVAEKWNVGVNTSVVFPEDEAAGTGVNVMGLVSYDVYKYAAVGVEVGYTTYEIDTLGVDWGRVNSMPIMGDVILKYPLELGDYLFVPYVTNGFGCLLTNVDESDTVNRAGISFETDPAFLYKLGGGFDFYVTKNIAVSFETSYLWAAQTWRAKVSGTSAAEESLSADALYLGGGLKIKF